jgi:succinyl-CoA synthetase beta subunit
MEIEEMAQRSPEKIIKEIIDPAVGMMPYQARKLAVALGFTGDMLPPVAKLLHGVYQAWWENDATLVEINPLCLVEQPDGKVSLVVDAKMSFDDNALYRHPNILAMRDIAEESPLETEASKHNLSYIKLNGNIGCMVNGAGLAMATMDMIAHYGGLPANFLDVGGSASREQVTEAFKILISDPNVRAIWINIFGGIMQCDTIAQGILAAIKDVQLKLPLVVRLAGTNADLAKQMIRDSRLPVIIADTFAEGAEKVVQTAAA